MKHLTDDQLIEHLYLDSRDTHLLECTECAHRLKIFEKHRRLHAEADKAGVTYTPLEQPRRERRAWIPAAIAAALVFAVAFVSFQPEPRPAISDTQFFAEMAALAQAGAPRAAAPIQALFEEKKP
jgi:hypothetical protein